MYIMVDKKSINMINYVVLLTTDREDNDRVYHEFETFFKTELEARFYISQNSSKLSRNENLIIIEWKPNTNYSYIDMIHEI